MLSQTKLAVYEELAYAKYEAVKDDPNFKRFLFATVKEEANDIVLFSRDEDPMNYEEAFRYFLFEELPQEHMTIKDFVCRRYLDRFSPYVSEPIIYQYHPEYDYSKRA